MSKPTPPGDTTASGSETSKAATFPIAKPYPECRSGMAREAPTIPGSAATFATCLTAGRKPPPGLPPFSSARATESASSSSTKVFKESLT